MKRKCIFSLIIIGALAVCGFMFWTVQKARKASNNILEQFKQIEKSLDSSNKLIQKSNDSLFNKLNNTQ
jgi:flagellar basal body-associated protein FliL